MGNFSCYWEAVHSTQDFNQDVAFPVCYRSQIVPLNDIVWDIVEVILGVCVLISCHWCFEVEVANIETGILCTVS